MQTEKIIHELKYNRLKALLPGIMIPLVIIEPIRRGVIQGIQFHEYYWFIFCFIAAAWAFWSFTRVAIHAVWGIPAIILTNEGIELTQLGYDIEWEDIDEINLVENSGKYITYSLAISVKDDWQYIGAIRNPLIRYYRWYTRDLYHNTPFYIQLNMLADDSSDVYAMVENCFHNYKNTGIYGR